MGEKKDIDGAQSEIEYFVTPKSQPTKPREIKVKKNDSQSVEISWEKPESPNGIIEYYEIILELYPVDEKRIMQRQFCDPKFAIQQVNELTKPQPDADQTSNDNSKDMPDGHCSCDMCSNDDIKPSPGTGNSKEQSAKKNAQNEFENALINTIWFTEPLQLAGVHCEEGRRKKRDISSDSSNRLGLQNEVDKGNNSSTPPSKEDERLQIFKKVNITKVNSSTTSFSVTNLKHFGTYSLKIRACQQGNHTPLVSALKCSDYAVEEFQVLHNASADKIIGGLKPVGDKHATDGKDDSGIDQDVKDHLTEKKGEPVFITWDPPTDPNLLIVNYDIRLEFDSKDFPNMMYCISAKKFEEDKRR